jgi:hypothetical protein
MLVLSDGYLAHGDCASVQYSGVGGREPRSRPPLSPRRSRPRWPPGADSRSRNSAPPRPPPSST